MQSFCDQSLQLITAEISTSCHFNVFLTRPRSSPLLSNFGNFNFLFKISDKRSLISAETSLILAIITTYFTKSVNLPIAIAKKIQNYLQFCSLSRHYWLCWIGPFSNLFAEFCASHSSSGSHYCFC